MNQFNEAATNDGDTSTRARSTARSGSRRDHAHCVRETSVGVRRRRSATEPLFTAAEFATISEAKMILDRKLFVSRAPLGQPREVADFLKLELAQEGVEVFCAIYLDNRHRVLAFCRLFYGTIDGCSVHPRTVVQHALRYNAAAVILAHNHPSGVPEPSQADIALTRRLGDALGLIDVRMLDHFIVAAGEPLSLAERGLL